MKVVHKLVFDRDRTGTPQEVTVPPLAKVVGFGFQDYTPVFWYETSTELAATEPRGWNRLLLQVVGTGAGYAADMDYLHGPVFLGDFVFHLVGRRA